MRTMTDDDANKNKSSSTNLYDPARPPPFSPSCGTHFRWSAKMFSLQFVYNNFISVIFTVLEKGGKPKVLEDMVEIYFRNKG